MFYIAHNLSDHQKHSDTPGKDQSIKRNTLFKGSAHIKNVQKHKSDEQWREYSMNSSPYLVIQIYLFLKGGYYNKWY